MRILSAPKPARAGARRARQTRAFSVTEMMVAVFIFVFLVLGIIYVWMFAMRYDELVCSKLGASEKSRMSFDTLTGDIRASKWWRIGNGTNAASFVPCGNATSQLGNALKLSADANTNSSAYIIYYFNTNNSPINGCTLCRSSNGVATVQIMVQSLTNTGYTPMSMAFHAEQRPSTNLVTAITDDDILHDLQFKYVIVTTMEFCQYQYPLTKVGPGYYYNYYCIQLKAASHCPN